MKKNIVAIGMLAVLLAGSFVGACVMEDNTSILTEVSSAENKEASKQGTVDYSKGFPWIDSDIKEAVSEDMVTDPKQDFNLYVNKDWILSNEIPAGMTSWSQYAVCADQVDQRCMDLLEEQEISDHNEELCKTLYNQILDTDSRNEAGVSPIQKKYKKILEIKSIKQLNRYLLSDKSKYSNNPFFAIDINTSLSDSKHNYVWLYAPSLMLGDSAEYENRTDYGDMKYKYRKKIFIYLAKRLGMSEKEAKKRYKSAIEMEAKLAKACMTSEEQMADDYLERVNNAKSFKELSAYSKNFPLTRLLIQKGLKYSKDYFVSEPAALEKLDQLYTKKNLEGLKNLILVKYISSNCSYLDDDAVQFSQKQYEKIYGVKGQLSKEKSAYYTVSALLNTPLQQMYLGKYGKDEDRQKVTKICEEVIATYREMLIENDWLSQKTKDYAVKKLDSIKINALYPDKFRDYSKLDITGLSYYQSVVAIAQFETQCKYESVGKKVEQECWSDDFDILSCNAFYSQEENTINMIIGMYGEPFYSEDMCTEDYYASLAAFWVGHEISHAFDNNGSQFDIDGNLNNWWTKKDKKEFKNRVKQFDEYLDTIVPFGEEHVKGSNVDSEMIADIMGMQCALRMAKKIEGFDYKKFFEKYASLYARINIYSNEIDQLTQDVHPLDYIRDNVVVQQFDEFYETYDVKEGDAMYLAPEKRLKLW